ncbi:MAG: S41 family peptidase [Erythrobacter sp.]|nr:S41 family peptidase [Erythrobacter sp.]
MRSAIEEGAAALDRHRPADEIAEIFDAAEGQLTQSMTPVEFWRTVAPAIAKVGDGHMRLDLDFGILIQALHGRRFPLRFMIEDGRFLVIENRSSHSVPVGSEIMTIDGLSAGQLIERCGAFIPADNELVSRKIRILERDFSSICVLALDLGPDFDVSVKERGKDVPRSLRLRGLTYGEWVDAASPEPITPQRPPFYELETWPDRRIALLSFSSLVRRDGVDPAATFKDIFGEIAAAGISDLIIDMRGSPGGRDSDAALLFGHLALDDFRFVHSRSLKKKRFDFVENTSDRGINDLLADMSSRADDAGRIVLEEELDRMQSPQPGAYQGRAFLIVDRGTFSSSSEFASVFQHYKRGPVIGEETGTASQGGSGAPVTMKLSATWSTIDVPIVAYRVPHSGEGHRGVMPDFAMSTSVEDFVHDRDPAMAKAVELIESARRAKTDTSQQNEKWVATTGLVP